MSFEVADLLEVQGLNKSEELVNCLLKVIVYKSVSEQHRIICQLNFVDR